MKSSRILILINLISVCFLSLETWETARAQNLDSVTITGRILDQNGSSLPGPEVSATLTSTQTRRSTVTDSEGRYRLIQLPPGTYVLEASCAGFEPQQRNELTTLAAQTLVQDFMLLPQTLIVEPVVITADQTAQVDTSRTVVGATLATHEIDEVPIVSRSPLDFVFTLPGVSEEPVSTRDLAEDRNTIPANTPEEAG